MLWPWPWVKVTGAISIFWQTRNTIFLYKSECIFSDVFIFWSMVVLSKTFRLIYNLMTLTLGQGHRSYFKHILTYRKCYFSSLRWTAPIIVHPDVSDLCSHIVGLYQISVNFCYECESSKHLLLVHLSSSILATSIWIFLFSFEFLPHYFTLVSCFLYRLKSMFV